jgi:hypothetical protein
VIEPKPKSSHFERTWFKLILEEPSHTFLNVESDQRFFQKGKTKQHYYIFDIETNITFILPQVPTRYIDICLRSWYQIKN